MHSSSQCCPHQCTYHLFGLGDLKDVADVDSGVDWNWPWPWQIVHPRAVALKYILFVCFLSLAEHLKLEGLLTFVSSHCSWETENKNTEHQHGYFQTDWFQTDFLCCSHMYLSTFSNCISIQTRPWWPGRREVYKADNRLLWGPTEFMRTKRSARVSWLVRLTYFFLLDFCSKWNSHLLTTECPWPSWALNKI